MVIKSRPIASLVLHILLMLFAIAPIVVYYAGSYAITEANTAINQAAGGIFSGSTEEATVSLTLALALYLVMMEWMVLLALSV